MTSALMFSTRRDEGHRAYLSGAAAEDGVATNYRNRGITMLETRWRGQGGEIDLILRDGPVVVFCEVKKVANAEAAFARLRPGQVQRIHAAAAEYLDNCPNGQLTEVRFDLAAVDVAGRVTVYENAFGHF